MTGNLSKISQKHINKDANINLIDRPRSEAYFGKQLFGDSRMS